MKNEELNTGEYKDFLKNKSAMMGGLPIPGVKHRQRIIQHRKRNERESIKRIQRHRATSPFPSTSLDEDATTAPLINSALDLPPVIEVKVLRSSEGLIIVEYSKDDINYTGILLAENTVGGAPGIMREEMSKFRETINSYVDSPAIDQWTSVLAERFTPGFQLRDRCFMRTFGRMVCAACMAPVPDNEAIPRRHFTNPNARKLLCKPQHRYQVVAQMSSPPVSRENNCSINSTANLQNASGIDDANEENENRQMSSKVFHAAHHLNEEEMNKSKSDSGSSVEENIYQDGLYSPGPSDLVKEYGQYGETSKTHYGKNAITPSSIKTEDIAEYSTNVSPTKIVADTETNQMRFNCETLSPAYIIRKSDGNALHMTFVRQSKSGISGDQRIQRDCNEGDSKAGTATAHIHQGAPLLVTRDTSQIVSPRPNLSFHSSEQPMLNCVSERKLSALSFSGSSIMNRVGSKPSVSSEKSIVHPNLPSFLYGEQSGNCSRKFSNMVAQSTHSEEIIKRKSNSICSPQDILCLQEEKSDKQMPSSLSSGHCFISNQITETVPQNEGIRSLSNNQEYPPIKIILKPVQKNLPSHHNNFDSPSIAINNGSAIEMEQSTRQYGCPLMNDGRNRNDGTSIRKLRRLPVRAKQFSGFADLSSKVKKYDTRITTNSDVFNWPDNENDDNDEIIPTKQENPLGLVPEDVVWAKNRTEAFWPGRLHGFTRENGKIGASIVWFGADTYSPFIELVRIERFTDAYGIRFNPKRAEPTYHRAVADSIIANLPAKGYFEQKLSPQVFKILLRSRKFDLRNVKVITKRRKKPAAHGPPTKKRRSVVRKSAKFGSSASHILSTETGLYDSIDPMQTDARASSNDENCSDDDQRLVIAYDSDEL